MAKANRLAFVFVNLVLVACSEEVPPEKVAQMLTEISELRAAKQGLAEELGECRAKIVAKVEPAVERPVVAHEPDCAAMPRCKVEDLVTHDARQWKLDADRRASELTRWKRELSRLESFPTDAEKIATDEPNVNAPLLPKGSLGMTIDLQSRTGTIARDPHRACECMIKVWYEESHMTRPFNGSWRQLALLVSIRFDQVIRSDLWPGMTTYERQADFFSNGYVAFAESLPIDGYDKSVADSSTLLQERVHIALREVVENEGTLKTVVTWGLPHLSALVSKERRSDAQSLLKDLWRASHTNLKQLDPLVSQDDYDEDRDRAAYLLDHNAKLEGLFLRRWRNAGRGQAGADRIVLYQFWMVKIAQELAMPQATAWAKEVRAKLAGTKTLAEKSWYQNQLK